MNRLGVKVWIVKRLEAEQQKESRRNFVELFIVMIDSICHYFLLLIFGIIVEKRFDCNL